MSGTVRDYVGNTVRDLSKDWGLGRTRIVHRKSSKALPRITQGVRGEKGTQRGSLYKMAKTQKGRALTR